MRLMGRKRRPPRRQRRRQATRALMRELLKSSRKHAATGRHETEATDARARYYETYSKYGPKGRG
jgi:hypothetical protein